LETPRVAEVDTPKSDEDPWLTVQQVSKELGVHEATVRTWISTKRLAASRPGPRRLRVRRSEVDRLLRSDPSFGHSPSPSPPQEAAPDPYTPPTTDLASDVITTSAARRED
jgi:excisionase family DNA binding protein